jgi:chromosome segregation ATPase
LRRIEVDEDFIPSGEESEADAGESPTLSTRKQTVTSLPKETRRKKRGRSQAECFPETETARHTKRMRHKLKRLKNDLSALEESQAAGKAELKHQKAQLKKQQRDIGKLRREMDVMAIELRVRAEACSGLM